MLENINSPKDVKKLNINELKILSEEIRREIISVTTRNGGHLASNLGSVELELALHYVFDAPQDKLVFDVGHQAYTHKIITGRRESFFTLRKQDGITGFPCHKESEYDVFDAGHSSTAISSALGLARARDCKNENYNVIALVGDGAIGGGMALEALNDTGSSPYSKLIIILNDNEMSISKNVGALSANFTKLRADQGYLRSKTRLKKFLNKINKSGKLSGFFARIRNILRYILIGENIFEAMNITYFGPIDGHSLEDLIAIFSRVKDCSGPVIIHTVTRKGCGYPEAEQYPELYHGVSPQGGGSAKSTSYGRVLGNTLVKLAENDETICAITAGMTYNTGLDEFSKKFPDRFFDTGIAEQHALALAGGLAKGGMKPYIVIYSTFLQRGFDQIFHDICLQELPAVICVDHAGLTGEDGATHQGIYDLGYLRSMPRLVILNPRDTEELRRMLIYASTCDKPIAIRYPKGSAENIAGDRPFDELNWDKVISGNNGSVLTFGIGISIAMKICTELGLNLIDARCLKPFDEAVLDSICDKPIYVIEDNAPHGGLYEGVLRYFSDKGVSVQVKGFYLKDSFVEVGTVKQQLYKHGIDENSIMEIIKNEIG